MKQSSFSTSFRIADPFNLDYVADFYQPKKRRSSPVFTVSFYYLLVEEIFGCY